MMAASTVGATQALCPAPKQLSKSVHDPSVVAVPSFNTSSTAPSDVESSDEDEIGVSFSSGSTSSSSSFAGQSRAVASGFRSTAAAQNLPDDETCIALSQLEELDEAIKELKVNKVDGRRTRWIEYREKCKIEKGISPTKVETTKNNKVSNVQKGPKTHRIIRKFLKTKAIRNTVAKILPEVDETKENLKKELVSENNNTICSNNNRLNAATMKVEMNGMVLTPLGANNVLETMKQQFLQGTNENPMLESEEKEKIIKNNKFNRGTISPNSEHSRRRGPGRPKRGTDRGASSPPIIMEESQSPQSPNGNIHPLNITHSDLELGRRVDSSSINAKSHTICVSSTDIYSRKQALTRDLRDIRKPDSGSESNTGTPVKEQTNLNSSPLILSLSPISPTIGPAPEETEVDKEALAKALADLQKAQPKKYKKKLFGKVAKKENINSEKIVNGHKENSINGISKAKKLKKYGKIKANDKVIGAKTRGRPKGKNNDLKDEKIVATVIAEVHNTMNGEPQTAIPVDLIQNKKKISPVKALRKPSVKDNYEIQEMNLYSKNASNNNISDNLMPNKFPDLLLPSLASDPLEESRNDTISASIIDNSSELIETDSTKYQQSVLNTVVPENTRLKPRENNDLKQFSVSKSNEKEESLQVNGHPRNIKQYRPSSKSKLYQQLEKADLYNHISEDLNKQIKLGNEKKQRSILQYTQKYRRIQPKVNTETFMADPEISFPNHNKILLINSKQLSSDLICEDKLASQLKGANGLASLRLSPDRVIDSNSTISSSAEIGLNEIRDYKNKSKSDETVLSNDKFISKTSQHSPLHLVLIDEIIKPKLNHKFEMQAKGMCIKNQLGIVNSSANNAKVDSINNENIGGMRLHIDTISSSNEQVDLIDNHDINKSISETQSSNKLSKTTSSQDEGIIINCSLDVSKKVESRLKPGKLSPSSNKSKSDTPTLIKFKAISPALNRARIESPSLNIASSSEIDKVQADLHILSKNKSESLSLNKSRTYSPILAKSRSNGPVLSKNINNATNRDSPDHLVKINKSKFSEVCMNKSSSRNILVVDKAQSANSVLAKSKEEMLSCEKSRIDLNKSKLTSPSLNKSKDDELILNKAKIGKSNQPQKIKTDALLENISKADNTINTNDALLNGPIGHEEMPAKNDVNSKTKTRLSPLSTRTQTNRYGRQQGHRYNLNESYKNPIPEIVVKEEPIDPNDIKIEPVSEEELRESKELRIDIPNTSEQSEKEATSIVKPKEKVPRFLKQLFQDEGVQNILRSMNEDMVPSDGLLQIDQGSHKLRPKRTNENMSESPEPEDYYLTSRRKKRGTEIDNLMVNEGAGTLNVLNSLDRMTSRRHADALSDSPPSSQSVKIPKPLKSALDVSGGDGKKRKLSDDASPNSMTPDVENIEAKRQKASASSDALETDKNEVPEIPSERLSQEVQSEIPRKKVGRPALPVGIKQKKNIQMLLRKQLHKMGIKDTANLSIIRMKQLIYREAKKRGLCGNGDKAVPPLKIKIPSDGSITVKPVTTPKVDEECVSEQTQSTAPQAQMLDHLKSPLEKVDAEQKSPNKTITEMKKPLLKQSPVASLKPLCLGSPKVIYSEKKSQQSICPERERLIAQKQLDSLQPSRRLNIPRPNAEQNAVPLTSLTLPLDAESSQIKVAKSKQTGEAVRQSQRTSVRGTDKSHFRDIALRKYHNFVQIILTPSTTKMKNSLNSRVLRELCEALSILRRDDKVNLVLLTSTGNTFCQGIDLTCLQHPNLETRKKNADNLTKGIKDFLRALVQFPKVIIAGVNGSAMGLGVTMLPLFDQVIATDSAEFYLPYAKLGQVPEGGFTYTFPNYYGKLQANKLFLGQKISATEALQMGLVSECLWAATYQQELLPKVAIRASQSRQAMEATKALMNHHLLTKLELSIESECRLLLQHWTSQTFSHLCKRFLDATHVQLQKPVNMPL